MVMSVSSVNAGSPHVWTEVEVEGRLTNKVIEVMQNIARLNMSNTNLDAGVHYPLPYVKALQDSDSEKNQERLKTFKEYGMSYHGYASPKHFKMVADPESPSGKQVLTFVLKPGVLASKALEKLESGLSVLGCGETCQVAQYRAILDVLGAEKFDALFAEDGPTPLIVSGTHPKNPISKLRNYICKKEANLDEVRRGDLVYFYNAASYQEKHQFGASQGYNSICMHEAGGSSRFTGLGWPSEGLNHGQIQKVMRSKYNADPANPREVLSEKIWKKLPKTRPDFQERQITPAEFTKEGGGKIQLVCQLDTKRITALANSTLADARRLLDSYNVSIRPRIVLAAEPEMKRPMPADADSSTPV